MAGEVSFRSVSPIGDTDTLALPVKEIGPAVGYYTQVLGFSLASKDETTARLQRDDVTIGLAVNGADPEQASCYFGVSDVEALRRELEAKGIEPTPLRRDEYGGRRFLVFFAKEPFGVCFCFGQPEPVAQERPGD
jgi:hypothetical protein